MKIIIIGAGLGGLAAAVAMKVERSTHDVLVIDSAAELAEIGAGLQVTPNATRLLERWGVASHLEKLATSPRIFTIHRYSDGSLLGRRENFGQEMHAKYNANYWDLHRADLQIALYDRARSLGVVFQFGTLVTEHNFETCELTCADGKKVKGDLIIAADGLWSRSRSAFIGKPSPPIPTGDLAYRIVLRTADITDPELREFASVPRVCLWVGPQCHAIYYPLKNNTMCNIVLLVPDNLPAYVAKQSGDLNEMHEIFKQWDPRLRKFLSMVEKVDKWKLMHLEEMELWYNEKATVVFLGDACHPMLPYMAQGAGSALEDGATLGILLSQVSTKDELLKALEVYQSIRKPRSSALQKGSMSQRYWNHLPDGIEQQERDLRASQQLDEQKPGYPFYWLDPAQQSFVYGYNVFEELRKAGIKLNGQSQTDGENHLLAKV